MQAQVRQLRLAGSPQHPQVNWLCKTGSAYLDTTAATRTASAGSYGLKSQNENSERGSADRIKASSQRLNPVQD